MSTSTKTLIVALLVMVAGIMFVNFMKTVPAPGESPVPGVSATR